MQELIARVENLLVEVQLAEQAADAHPMLRGAAKSLEKIRLLLIENKGEAGTLKREATGLFRYVTDDGAFMESPIGQKLLELTATLP